MKSIGNIGKIIISKELENQIDYYHKQIKKDEWSGILFYKHSKGDIHSLSNLEFTATNLYLMDIGSGTFTNFENDSDIIKAYNNIGDDNLESLTGMIHSHHNMKAFFSGTDLQELKDNAMHYNFYISLIVNFDKEYVCKIVFPSKTTTKSEYLITDNKGKVKKVIQKSEDKTLLDGDLTVEFENNNSVDDWVINRIKEVKDKKQAKTFNNVNARNFNNQQELPFSYYDNDYYYKPHPKPTVTTTKFKDFADFADSTSLNNSFLREVLCVEENKSIEEGIKDLDTLTNEEFVVYLDFLELNLEILYENVYTSFDTIDFEKALNLLITKLKTYKGNKISKLVGFLEQIYLLCDEQI